MSGQTSDDQQIGARSVALPRSVSAAARRYLEELLARSVGAPTPSTALPPAEDFAAWRSLKAQVNGVIGEQALAAAANLRATSEQIEVKGVKVHLATPTAPSAPAKCVFLDIHGGALVYGEGGFSCAAAMVQADRHGVLCYGVDYRTPPEHPYPAALDDCLAVYRALLERYEARNIVVGGLSAGGNLAAATVLRARDEGLPLPAAIVLLTPELDLTESGDTFQTNQFVDFVVPQPLMEMNLLYAGAHALDDPYLSPLFGDFSAGFPPTFLQAGTRDIFLSNTVRMHRALRQAGVQVELHIFEGMPHGGFHGAPEDLELADEVSRFVREQWGRS